MRVVADAGFSGLTVGSVCRRAGVSEATFHLHWPDAWAVVLALLDERGRLPSLPDEGDLLDDLVSYARAYHQHSCTDPAFAEFMFQLLAATRSDAGLRKRLAVGFAQRRARNRVLVDRAVARGELPPGAAGEGLLDAVLGLCLSWMGTGSAPSQATIERAVEQLIANAQRHGPSRQEAGEATISDGQYRLHLFERSPEATPGRNTQQPVVGSSDPEAIANANVRRLGQYAELWKGDRLLRIFDADRLAGNGPLP